MLTVYLYVEFLVCFGRNSIVGLTDISAHMLPIDLRNIQSGAFSVAPLKKEKEANIKTGKKPFFKKICLVLLHAPSGMA